MKHPLMQMEGMGPGIGCTPASLAVLLQQVGVDQQNVSFFSYELGSGLAVILTKTPLNDNSWHTVKVLR